MTQQYPKASVKINPPFRADHVGSLLRPPELRRAYRSLNKGEITSEEFHEVQDKAIRDVVRLQEAIGLRSITDGEYRRASYWGHFVAAVDGFTIGEAIYTFRDEENQQQTFLAPYVSGKVRHVGSISGAEFDFLNAVTSQTAKLTMPSPPTMHFWRGRQAIAPGIYEDIDAFFDDLARVYQTELADLAARGATYIQIDEVPLAMLCDPDVRARIQAAGEEPERFVDRYIELINQSLAGRAEQMTVAMHLCRGNFKGKWLSEGGYDYVAERLFNEVDVDAYFLEYDTPRAGDFSPLQAVPAHKSVVLGLVSTKTPHLESIDSLRRRIDKASHFMPLERLAISPQCGFASTVAGNPITWQDQINKLELIVEVARLVWGES